MLIPCIGGIFAQRFKNDLKRLHAFTACMTLLTLVFSVLTVLFFRGEATIFYFNDVFTLKFAVDELSCFFMILIPAFFTFVAFYAFVYMEHEGHEGKFFTFFLLTLASLMALSASANAITMYMCFEAMTLLSFPLILHNREENSRTAAIYYICYSVIGASFALFGFFLISKYAGDFSFAAGGYLAEYANEPVVLAGYFFIALGFGAKAGLVPLQAWLPMAHPIAPSPASALLSSIVTKGGVLSIMRVTFYIFGADMLRGTWPQTVLIILALITVFTGSMLALREKVIKKRFAYSTVSQVSYVLFGIFLLNPDGLQGSILQIVYHAFAKGILFLFAGVMIYKFGYTRVEELKGIGKRMPALLLCFTFAGLRLIGIPPAGGFVSKWFLAMGGLSYGGVIGVVGVAVLLISALLTAFYVMPITAEGFFPGNDYPPVEKKEPAKGMLVPMIVFAAVILVFGVFPQPIINFATNLTAAIL